MEKKNNSLVIILMGVIIVILAVLCVLFATGTVNLKSNESGNEANNQEVESQNSNLQIENNDEAVKSNNIKEVYFGYFSNSNISYSTQLILFNTNKFTKCDRYECLSGTYEINGDKLNLRTDSTEKYPTVMNYNYTISNNENVTKLKSEKQEEYCDLKEIGTNEKIRNVYFGYFNNSNISYSEGLVLLENNSFVKCSRYECFSGKYKINNEVLELTTEPTEEYPTVMNYNYTISNNENESKLKSNKQEEYCDLTEIK